LFQVISFCLMIRFVFENIMQGAHEIGGVGNVVNELSAAFRIVECNHYSTAKAILPDITNTFIINTDYYLNKCLFF